MEVVAGGSDGRDGRGRRRALMKTLAPIPRAGEAREEPQQTSGTVIAPVIAPCLVFGNREDQLLMKTLAPTPRWSRCRFLAERYTW